ncbi:MAG: flagellar biosynthesis anti-sigma factor FlgM [Elusimicrobia bacterium]|nr:flagellar biosynthesis anti-sigma factor FlgM [Elusimicrobiota bacterium]
MINPIGNKGPDEVVRPEVAEEAAAAKKSVSVQGGQKNAIERAPAEGDKVELSSFARDIQAIRQRLGDQAAERAAQVEALRVKIEQGTYQPDTKVVAQKMFEIGITG